MSKPIGRSSEKETPDETMIEAMLSQYQPHPSQEFREKMDQAPWRNPLPSKRTLFTSHNQRFPRLRWAVPVFIILLAFLGVLFIPSIGVIARQIFYTFIQAPSNQLQVQVTLTNPSDLYNFSDPSNFPLSILKAEHVSGLKLKQIQPLPAELSFVGAMYDDNVKAVISMYQAEGYKLFLTQRQAGNGSDVFSIGASAQVSLVEVNGQQAEFVTGGWVSISTQTTPNPSSGGVQANIAAEWDSTLPQYTLRWKAEGNNYELRSTGEGSPSESQLIIFANELK